MPKILMVLEICFIFFMHSYDVFYFVSLGFWVKWDQSFHEILALVTACDYLFGCLFTLKKKNLNDTLYCHFILI